MHKTVEPVLATDEAIFSAAEVLRRGGIVAFPTETVYGLGADAKNPKAVARVFEVKGRPRLDPMIVHLSHSEEMELIGWPCDLARVLADVFWPGPLTIVLRKRELIPDIVTAGLSTVAVRVPDNSVARRLIDAAGCPVAAPSANPFGYISPTTASHVRDGLGEYVDVILDGGPCRLGLESTVIAVDGYDKPTLLRHGAIPSEEIEEIIGPIAKTPKKEDGFKSPGMLSKHYAPRTPMLIISDKEPPVVEQGMRIGLLALTTPVRTAGYIAVEVLSSQGDLREASSNLFSAMRRLDAAGLDLIHCEPVPESGLGAAIMDRLRRASSASCTACARLPINAPIGQRGRPLRFSDATQ